MRTVPIVTEYITISQFLKFMNIVSSGGIAKALLEEEQITINNKIETKRGRKCYPGDQIYVKGIDTFNLVKDET
ncbi:MAG: RNA-binding S4 domain-containing protein [Candidatus Izimaplasma sp.]|nr:RNA-binding S4 domain-containing protein [Candidatus Izimaplasma bacterium]